MRTRTSLRTVFFALSVWGVWLAGCGGNTGAGGGDASSRADAGAAPVRCGSMLCDPRAICDTSSGAPECACAQGYEGDGLSCADIDECARDMHECAPLATCENTPGSFECVCPPGLAGDGTSCSGLYTVTAMDGVLRRIDPDTAETIESIPIVLPGSTVQRGVGLAQHPITGVVYAILHIDGDQDDRALVTLDPFTGEAALVGHTGLRIAAIAFDGAGLLYAVTGRDRARPETLFLLDTSTGAPSELTPLGNGDDGEALAFNHDDGLLYHASGRMIVTFETVDPISLTVTPIDILGSTLQSEEVQGLAYRADMGMFVWKQDIRPGPLFLVSPDGEASLIGMVDHKAKGIAFVRW